MGIKIVTEIETPRHGSPGELRKLLEDKVAEFWIAVGRWKTRYGAHSVGRAQMQITSTDRLVRIEYYAHAEEKNPGDSSETNNG